MLKKSLGPKNGLERRVKQFYTICDKNHGLKVKIDEVTAILVPRSGGATHADRVDLAVSEKDSVTYKFEL